MMMRKRTNRCRNTVWDISVISRNKNGETLCGDQCALEWDDNDATVILSDGLGSGVKANILSTLTTTMLTTMLKGNVPIDECVTTVAETLPMCRERKLAYATFTILQTAGTRARLIQYDNPNAVFVHNGAIGKYNYSVNFIQEKELHESYLHFDVGDMLVLFSDGVSEAGRGVTTDAGWARQDIEDFILRNYSPTVSSQRMAASILSTVKTLDMDAMHDDTTVVVARLRERCPVNVMIGPPESKDDDLSTMRLFFGKDGKHVVCGGTTANAVASYLGVKVHTLPGSGTEWLVVLALALVCSGFGFTLQPVAQSGTTADHAALFCALNPFVAAALGAVCFHEHFGIAGLLGGALILAGIVVSCWPQKTGG